MDSCTITLNQLVNQWPRILILYPAYFQVSSILESQFPLVKMVREDYYKYNKVYISDHGMSGDNVSTYQIVELLTNLNGRHVEIMAVLFRSEPCWYTLRNIFAGHIFAQLSDCLIPNLYTKIPKLSTQFLSIPEQI